VKAVTALILIAILVVLVVACLYVAGRALWRRGARRRYVARVERLALQPWAGGERSDGELYHIYCQKPGEDDIPIGHVGVRAPDFDMLVRELREEQDDKLRTLNDRRTI
jgi:hypothetical protein